MVAMLLIGVVVPALVAGFILVAAWRPWRRQSQGAIGAWAFAPAIAICTLLSFGAVESWTPWTQVARWHGLLPLALTTAALGVLVHWVPARWLATFCVCTLLGASAGVWIDLPGVGGMAERTGLATAVFLLALVTAPLARRVHSIALALALAITFATLSALLWNTHFAKLSLIVGSITTACVAAGVVSAIDGRNTLGLGAALVCGAFIPAFALTGYAYDYDTVPLASWGLVCIAVPAVWVTEHPWIKRRAAWQACAMGVVAVALPCVAALALGIAPDDEENIPPGYGECSQVDSSRDV